MTRREAALLVAGGPALLAKWAEAKQQAYVPKFFSHEEFEALDAYTAILIPTDDTPGAREAQVAQFIDFLADACAEYAPEEQQHWRSAMAYLNAKHFFGGETAQQLAIVQQMSQPSSDGFRHFTLIKTAAVHAFYTSQVGLMDVLQYKGLAYLTEFPACNHPEHGGA